MLRSRLISAISVSVYTQQCDIQTTSAPFYWHGLTLIPAWISNHIHYEMYDEITYPFLNFNGATVEV